MSKHTIKIDGACVGVRAWDTIIVGAGAAGMGAALRLWEALRDRGVAKPETKIAVITAGRTLGASRMSGSDKQTYYKMGTSPRVSDSAEAFAQTLTAGGCAHGDIALAEGLGSLRGFYGLVESGVPFPRDPWGAFLGYKTDHDPAERATSAGPKTSKFMSECLEARVRRCGIEIIDRQEVVALVPRGRGKARRIVGVLCADRGKLKGKAFGLTAYAAANVILAAGGAGAIYRDSVYPLGQVGLHGLALRAGLRGVNFTESQFGLASTKFRWNVSGTYMQVVPRIYSTDADGGDEREFLTEYFPDMRSMATNIFLKGYQWPFDAQRIENHQSSLVDLAVHEETIVRGRRVWMDFLRNPVGAPGWDKFSIDALGEEARSYLVATGANQKRPIDRLAHMNTPAIEIYAENDIDLWAEPLEIALCAQHHNGGMEVDCWWQSNIPQTFVVGEMAGTHGVKRPGGSALNAGQVGAIRAAEYIAGVYGRDSVDVEAALGAIAPAAERILETMRTLEAAEAELTPDDAMQQIGRWMSEAGAHLRSLDRVEQARAELAKLHGQLRRGRVRTRDRREVLAAMRAEHQCVTALAMLQAIAAMFARDAGSRGSHCMLAPDGKPAHPKLIDPTTGTPYRIRPENQSLRQEVLRIALKPGKTPRFEIDSVPTRPIPHREIAFESAWGEYRHGKIFDLAEKHPM